MEAGREKQGSGGGSVLFKRFPESLDPPVEGSEGSEEVSGGQAVVVGMTRTWPNIGCSSICFRINAKGRGRELRGGY